MTRYKRIPKNWLERILFRLRPQIVEATKLQDYAWMRGQDPIDGVYKSSKGAIYSAEYFEANYEPVYKKCLTTCKNCRNTFETELTHPFCTTQICPVCEHQFSQTGNMVYFEGSGWENNPQSMLYKNKLPTEGQNSEPVDHFHQPGNMVKISGAELDKGMM
jgi:hypothetical protein